MVNYDKRNKRFKQRRDKRSKEKGPADGVDDRDKNTWQRPATNGYEDQVKENKLMQDYYKVR